MVFVIFLLRSRLFKDDNFSARRGCATPVVRLFTLEPDKFCLYCFITTFLIPLTFDMFARRMTYHSPGVPSYRFQISSRIELPRKGKMLRVHVYTSV